MTEEEMSHHCAHMTKVAAESFLYSILKKPDSQDAQKMRAEIKKGGLDRVSLKTFSERLSGIDHDATFAVFVCRCHFLIRPETRWVWLEDSYWKVRQAALSSYAMSDVTPEMIKVGLADSVWQVRKAALENCCLQNRTVYMNSIKELILTGLKDPERDVRHEAIQQWKEFYRRKDNPEPIPLEIIRFWLQMPDRDAHFDAMVYSLRDSGYNNDYIERIVPLDIVQAGLQDSERRVYAEALYICERRALPPEVISAGVANDPGFCTQLARLRSCQDTASPAEIQEWLSAFDWRVREAANVVFHQVKRNTKAD